MILNIVGFVVFALFVRVIYSSTVCTLQCVLLNFVFLTCVICCPGMNLYCLFSMSCFVCACLKSLTLANRVCLYSKLSILGYLYSFYIRRFFGGRHPLCAIGVCSVICFIIKFDLYKARIELSFPYPSPFK